MELKKDLPHRMGPTGKPATDRERSGDRFIFYFQLNINTSHFLIFRRVPLSLSSLPLSPIDLAMGVACVAPAYGNANKKRILITGSNSGVRLEGARSWSDGAHLYMYADREVMHSRVEWEAT
jgi:hypothetical protein